MAATLLNKIKKRFSKAKKKNISYFIQENVIQGYGDLKSVVRPLPDTEPIPSKQLFSLNDITLDKVEPKILKQKYGTPSLILKNDHNIENHKIYFFRDKVGFYKILIQFHFIGNNFFFVSTRLSVPKGLSGGRKRQIVKRALEKYSVNAPNQVKSLDIKLIDAQGNLLFVNDYVSFYLNYLANNETTRQIYHELWESNDERRDNGDTMPDIEKFI